MESEIMAAREEDLQEILALQYLAYQSEAALVGNPNIPPLTQTLEELTEEYRRGILLKAVDRAGALVGSVRGYVADGTLFVGKLMVRPDRQGRGLGAALLEEIERLCPHRRCELFTSSLSERNLRLYQRQGYRIFREEELPGGLRMIYLEK